MDDPDIIFVCEKNNAPRTQTNPRPDDLSASANSEQYREIANSIRDARTSMDTVLQDFESRRGAPRRHHQTSTLSEQYREIGYSMRTALTSMDTVLQDLEGRRVYGSTSRRRHPAMRRRLGLTTTNSDVPNSNVPNSDVPIPPPARSNRSRSPLPDSNPRNTKKMKTEEVISPAMQSDDLLELSNVSLVANKTPFECPICFMEIAVLEGVTLKDCLHNFCRECLTNTIRHSEEFLVKCPFVNNEYTCESFLQEREIKSLLVPEDYERHLDLSMSLAERQSSNSFHCKTADCAGWCLLEGEVNEFQCQVCNTMNCVKCEAIHTGQSCQQFKEWKALEESTDENVKKTKQYLESQIETKKAMTCPKCNVILTKNGGCDTVRCRCGTLLCWTHKGEYGKSNNNCRWCNPQPLLFNFQAFGNQAHRHTNLQNFFNQIDYQARLNRINQLQTELRRRREERSLPSQIPAHLRNWENRDHAQSSQSQGNDEVSQIRPTVVASLSPPDHAEASHVRPNVESPESLQNQVGTSLRSLFQSFHSQRQNALEASQNRPNDAQSPMNHEVSQLWPNVQVRESRPNHVGTSLSTLLQSFRSQRQNALEASQNHPNDAQSHLNHEVSQLRPTVEVSESRPNHAEASNSLPIHPLFGLLNSQIYRVESQLNRVESQLNRVQHIHRNHEVSQIRPIAKASQSYVNRVEVQSPPLQPLLSRLNTLEASQSQPNQIKVLQSPPLRPLLSRLNALEAPQSQPNHVEVPQSPPLQPLLSRLNALEASRSQQSQVSSSQNLSNSDAVFIGDSVPLICLE